MADRRYHVTSISRADLLKCACGLRRVRRVHLSMRTESIKTFSNGYGVVVWTGENDTKTISVDANLFRLKTD